MFIDDVWIDDACAITYKVVDNKVPKFGYNDRKYRAVAMGTTIVQGRLSINFRYNGYLRSVIMDLVRKRRDTDLLSTTNRRRKYTANNLNDEYLKYHATDVLEWASAVAASQDEDKRNSVFEFLKQRFWSLPANQDPTAIDQAGGRPSDTPDQRSRSDELQALQRAGLIAPGFNIIMVFSDDPANYMDPALVKVIQDVHLVGEAVVANIEVPDGSRAIREVYDFFAKDVKPGKIGQQTEVVA